jgi:hypothetical protein
VPDHHHPADLAMLVGLHQGAGSRFVHPGILQLLDVANRQQDLLQRFPGLSRRRGDRSGR